MFITNGTSTLLRCEKPAIYRSGFKARIAISNHYDF